MKKNKVLKEVDLRIRRNRKIEAISRELCSHNGINPDIIVCKMMPAYLHYPVPTFELPNPQHTMPAWWLFREVVEAALSMIELSDDA